MLKFFLIAKNNIKKAKASTLTLIVLVSIVTILLYVGISVLTQIGNFIDDKNDSINGAHEIVISDREIDDTIKNILETTDGFLKMQQSDGVMFGTSKIANISMKEKAYSIPVLFQSMDSKREISRLKVIEETNSYQENSIVLPYVLKGANGYETGDTLSISTGNKSFSFVVGGFYEDVVFSNQNNLMLINVYVPEEMLRELELEVSAKTCSVTLALLDDVKKSETFEKDMVERIKQEITDSTQVYLTSNYLSLKMGSSIFLTIVFSILLAFSLIILVVSLIVIRFSSTTQMENNIKNIGTMQACGYTSNQLLFAILVEYIIIACIGYVLGVFASFGITPVVTQIVSYSIGLKWIAKPSLLAAVSSLVLIILSVLSISYASGAKIRKITPLTALRSGIENHNFKKSKVPLDKTNLNIDITISIKEFFYNKGQNVAAGIIIMVLSMVCILTLATYYNFILDNKAMIQLMGIENAQIQMNIPIHTDQILEEISKCKEVDKTIKINEFTTTIKNKEKVSNTLFKVTDDYSKLQIQTIVKGRMPIHENEISMTKLILDELGANVGDTVEVEYKGITQNFLVVGITQHISQLGKGAEITTEGMKRLEKDYKGTTAMIYLKDGVDTNDFAAKLTRTYKDEKVQVMNLKETLENMMKSFEATMLIVSIGSLAIAAMIIVFVMYLIIKVRVRKERMRMGIWKALGFTSGQLTGHILMSQIPVILVSSILGSIAGYFFTNPMIAFFLSSNGILNCPFYVDPRYVIVTPIGITILGILTILFVCLEIRKICPIKMLEQAVY